MIVYFASVISNRSSINDLRREMHTGFLDLRAAMTTRIDGLRSDVSARSNDLRSDLGARLERIEKKQEALDAEIRIGHDHRIAVLEARILHQAS